MNIYDIHQNMRIAQAETENHRTARTVDENQELILELQKSVKKLSFICNAMWQVLKDNTDICDQDLIAKIEQLQLEAKETSACPKCGRSIVNRKISSCLYCGTSITKDNSANELFNY